MTLLKAITIRPNHYELGILDALKEYTGERTYSKAIIQAATEFEHWRRRADTAEKESAILWAKIDKLCDLARQQKDVENRMYCAMNETIIETERATHRVTEKLRERAQASQEVMDGMTERLRERAQASQEALEEVIERLSERVQASQEAMDDEYERLSERVQASQGVSKRISENVEGISLKLIEALSNNPHPAAKELSTPGISPLVEALIESTRPTAKGLGLSGIPSLVETLSKSPHPAAKGLGLSGIPSLAEALIKGPHPAAKGLSNPGKN